MGSRMWENSTTVTNIMVCEYGLGLKNSGWRPQVGGLL
jgi:hypothetical protein